MSSISGHDAPGVSHPAGSPSLAAASSPTQASASAPASTVPVPAPAPAPASTPAAVEHTPVSPPAQALAALAQQASAPGPLPRPDSNAAPAGPTPYFPQNPSSPPMRNDGQAASAALRSSETNNTSRRNGPLSQQSREKAALIRKMGACKDCKRRRVGCQLHHHGMTWEEAYAKYNRSHSPSMQDIAPSLAAGRPLSPAAGIAHGQPIFTHDPEGMEIDSTPPHGRQSLSESRRTPLPSGPSGGPRLEKSLSLPGIESLRNELQSNAARMLSTSSRSRYNAVYAFFLFWEDDDDLAAVQSSANELAEVLQRYYHYTLDVKTIPSSTDGSKGSWRWLSRELHAFAEHQDQRDVLKVVYYAGSTHLDGNREMVLASSRDSQKATTIRWNGIQQILEEASADTLIIMDAPYFPSSKMVRQIGVLELIAASMSDEHYAALDRCAFTRALTELLRTRASRSSPMSAAEAHSALFSAYPKLVRDVRPEQETIGSFPAPLHIMMSGNSRLPSIFIAPLTAASPLRASLNDNNPVLQMNIRLADDNVDLDTWGEWLRLMPEGVRDVKVDGPFRPAYR